MICRQQPARTILQESGSASSTTYATLTEGKITIGGQSTSAASLGAHTDLATANRGGPVSLYRN